MIRLVIVDNFVCLGGGISIGLNVVVNFVLCMVVNNCVWNIGGIELLGYIVLYNCEIIYN